MVIGRPIEAELVAATLGTVPNVGVGLLMISPLGVCICDDCVAIDEAEFDLVGLAGGTAATGEGEGASPDDEACFTNGGAVTVVGVGTGVGVAEDIENVVSDG